MSQPVTSSAKTTSAFSRNKTRILVISFCSLLMISVLSLSGYIWYQLCQLHDQTHDSLRQLHAQYQQLAAQSLQYGTQLTKLTQKNLAKNQVDIQDYVVLQKVHQYLELAHIESYWRQNSKSTLILLVSAQEILNQNHINNTDKLKQTIAQEIMQLKAIPAVDLTGRLSKLDALITLTQQLTVKSMHRPKDNDDRHLATTDTWHERFTQSLWALKKMVVVKRLDDPAPAILSPLHTRLLQDLVAGYIMQAQWATIHGQEKLYHQALRAAMKLIHQRFADNIKAQTYLNELKQLDALSVTFSLPALAPALTEVQQLLDQLNTSSIKDTAYD